MIRRIVRLTSESQTGTALLTHPPFWYPMIGMSLSPVETIDLHLHGIDGFDTKDGEPESVARIAEREGMAGVSEILLSICSGPVPEMRHQIDAVRQAMKFQTAGATAEREGGDGR